MYGENSLFLNSDAFGYAAAGITGGVSSSVAGGNFWHGTGNGVITEGLNHLAHDHPVKPNLQKANNLIDKLKEAGWILLIRILEVDLIYGETKILAKFMKLPKGEVENIRLLNTASTNRQGISSMHQKI
jgi:hypothetical protein